MNIVIHGNLDKVKPITDFFDMIHITTNGQTSHFKPTPNHLIDIVLQRIYDKFKTHMYIREALDEVLKKENLQKSQWIRLK